MSIRSTLFRLFILVSAFFLCSCSSTISVAHEFVGLPAPTTRFTLLDDKSYHSLEEYKGKTIVLSFWDANCSHCRRAMPDVALLSQGFADRNDIVFIAISINANNEEQRVKDSIEELQLGSMVNAFSGNDVMDEAYLAYKGGQVPYLILIDKKGIVRWMGGDAGDLRKQLLTLVRLHPL